MGMFLPSADNSITRMLTYIPTLADPQVPITTIPPFADTAIFPPCAVSCGPLYDANGACVPPAAAQADADTYEDCFCSHNAVAAFSTAFTGICDAACGQAELTSIGGWFRDLCAVEGGGGGNGGGGNGGGATTTNSDDPAATGGGDSDSGSGSDDASGGGDW